MYVSYFLSYGHYFLSFGHNLVFCDMPIILFVVSIIHSVKLPPFKFFVIHLDDDSNPGLTRAMDRDALAWLAFSKVFSSVPF